MKLEEPVDWLILGDSSCNQGVIPELFKQNLNETALNLCTVGNFTLINDLWMLEYYIQRFGPPNNVLIVHIYDVWERSINATLLSEIPMPWGYWNDFSLSGEIIATTQQELAIFIERNFPLYSQNKSIAKIIRDTFFLQRNPLQPTHHLEPDGFMIATEPKPQIVLAEKGEHLTALEGKTFFMSYPNQIALDKTIEVAEQYGIQIYLANGPTYEGLYEELAFQEYISPIRDQLMEYGARSPNFHYFPEFLTFAANQMQNVDHLITPAAETYTQWLLQAIQNTPH